MAGKHLSALPVLSCCGDWRMAWHRHRSKSSNAYRTIRTSATEPTRWRHGCSSTSRLGTSDIRIAGYPYHNLTTPIMHASPSNSARHRATRTPNRGGTTSSATKSQTTTRPISSDRLDSSRRKEERSRPASSDRLDSSRWKEERSGCLTTHFYTTRSRSRSSYRARYGAGSR
jgi:hypothetical protein